MRVGEGAVSSIVSSRRRHARGQDAVFAPSGSAPRQLLALTKQNESRAVQQPCMVG